MNIAISSKNPVKIEAVISAFEKVFVDKDFNFLSSNIKSGVSDQPFGNSETIKGAMNRASKIAKLYPEADFCLGIEGGISTKNNELTAFAWIVIKSNDKISKAKTSSFELPRVVGELLKKGYELGEADDIVFKKKNSKQKNGAVGLLTNNIVTRKDLYEQAIILALIPHINESLY